MSFWQIAKYLSFSFLHWISDVVFRNIKIQTYNSLKMIIFMRCIYCQLNQWKINCLWARKRVESVKNGEISTCVTREVALLYRIIQNIIWTYDEQRRMNFLKEIVNIKQNVYTFHENDDQFLSKDELQDIIDYISTC